MRASQIAHAQSLLSKLHGARRQLEVISDVPRIPEGLIIMVQGTNDVVTLDGPDTEAVRELVYQLLAGCVEAVDRELKAMGIEPDE